MPSNSFRRDSSRPVASTRTPRAKRSRITSNDILEVAPRMRQDFVGVCAPILPLLVLKQRATLTNGTPHLKKAGGSTALRNKCMVVQPKLCLTRLLYVRREGAGQKHRRSRGVCFAVLALVHGVATLIIRYRTSRDLSHTFWKACMQKKCEQIHAKRLQKTCKLLSASPSTLKSFCVTV